MTSKPRVGLGLDGGRRGAAGSQHVDAVANGELAPKTALVLKRLAELGRVVEFALGRLLDQDASLLRTIGRAWDWRRRLERGDVTTIADLAREEGISDRYVSRVIRLAWLSPSVLERLVLRREPTVLSFFDLCGLAELPWVQQPEKVFD